MSICSCVPFRRLAWLLGVWLLPQTAHTASSALEGKVRIEAAFEPSIVHVQAQTIFRLRLYQAVSIDAMAMEPPRIRFAEVRPIAGERIGEEIRHGMRYRVVERRYAVFPFASGNWSVAGAGVSGKVVSSAGRPLTLRLEAPTTELAVRSIPVAIDPADWLPARAVKLSEQWLPDPNAIKLGETIKRTVRIEASGVDAAQIPELSFRGIGFTAHAVPARLSNRLEDGLNIGVREQDWTLVPDGSGIVSVPAMRLAWWDGQSGMPHEEVLPARTLQIATDNGVASPPPAPEAIALPAFSAAVVGLICGVGITFGLRRWRQTAPRRALASACRKNQPRIVQAIILEQAQRLFPHSPPRSLGELSVILGDQKARMALGELERQIYGPAAPLWQGERLYAALASSALFRQRGRSLPGVHARART